MEPLEDRPRRHYRTSTLVHICGVAWGGAAYGYAASIISTTIGQPSFLSYMGLDTAPNATSLLGASNALFFVGGVFGSFLVGELADRYGRKMVIGIGVLLMLISQALLAGAVHVAMFIAFRFVCGIGGYMALTAVPLWITEIVPPKDRGILLDINPIFLNIGYNCASWTGVGFYFYKSSDAWRGPIGLGCLPCILCLVWLPFVPESPRYLLIKGRTEEAWAIVRDLHSFHGDESFAEREFRQMRQQIQFDTSLKMGYLEMMRRPSYRKRVFMAVGLIFTLVSSGVLVIGNYGTILYGQLGYNNQQQLFLQAGWLGSAFTANILAVFIVDRMPRHILMTIGLTGCVVCVILEAALVATYLDTDNKNGLAACVAFLFLYVFSYGFFLDGVTWWYTGEIFPTHLRAQGMTIGMATYALTNIVWLQAAPTAFANIGWKYYLFFIIITSIGTVAIFLTFPDTLNKPLEEVARLFGDDDLVVAYQTQFGNAEEQEKVKVVAEVEESAIKTE